MIIDFYTNNFIQIILNYNYFITFKNHTMQNAQALEEIFSYGQFIPYQL